MLKIEISTEIQKQGPDATYFDPIQLEMYEDLDEDKLILKFDNNNIFRIERQDFLKIAKFFETK